MLASFCLSVLFWFIVSKRHLTVKWKSSRNNANKLPLQLFIFCFCSFFKTQEIIKKNNKTSLNKRNLQNLFCNLDPRKDRKNSKTWLNIQKISSTSRLPSYPSFFLFSHFLRFHVPSVTFPNSIATNLHLRAQFMNTFDQPLFTFNYYNSHIAQSVLIFSLSE